ncbi:MAG: hypothetical protein KJO88_09075 [Gammaproteobacteria bacterium]|nr:hypothetical protein [Gammaproteobacteria bacterium]NNM14685.1 hypothetical protein [Gammaproteobacteria bacterium]
MQAKQMGKSGLIVLALLVLAGLVFLFASQTGKDLRSGSGEVADKAGQMAKDVSATLDAGAVEVDAAIDTAALGEMADSVVAASEEAGEMVKNATDKSQSYLQGFVDSAKKTLKPENACQALAATLDEIANNVKQGSLSEADGLAKIKLTMQQNKACVK